LVRFGKKGRTRQRGAPLGPLGATKALHSVLTRYGAAREIREHRILIYWSKIVGPRVAAHTTPDALSKGTLWVRVDSSSWMHQLSFLKEEILAKANELCGETLVNEIRFHLGRPKEKSNDAIAAAARIRRPPAAMRSLPPPAVGSALAAIEDEAKNIEDDELRLAIIDIRRRLNL
jgi:predicted nucleic acid-binding Zn ribbon protein